MGNLYVRFDEGESSAQKADPLYSTGQTLVQHAAVNSLRAAVLLGINCTFQNDDIELLTLKLALSAIAEGVMELPREKTEANVVAHFGRRTIEALEAWLAIRPSSDSVRCFLRHDGKVFTPTNGEVSKYFRACREMAGVRHGGFSWLRKTFATLR